MTGNMQLPRCQLQDASCNMQVERCHFQERKMIFIDTVYTNKNFAKDMVYPKKNYAIDTNLSINTTC